MQETQVPSLGRGDPLEEKMATHFSILAWKFHGQRSLVGYSPRVGHDRVTVISVPDFLIVKTDMWVTAQGNECWELAGRKCEGTEWGIH